MSQIIAAVFISSMAMGAASLEQVPAFNEDVSTPSVLVATSQPGESYAVPEECMPENGICLRFPLWFRAELIQTLYGQAPNSPLKIVTYTHYGQPEPDTRESPRILLVLTNEGVHLMPVYATERVWRHTDGRYFILVDSPYPIHWLPCSASDLRESIRAEDFPKDARFAPDDFLVKEHPDSYSIASGYAFPRFGISVQRIGEHLRDSRPSSRDFTCVADES